MYPKHKVISIINEVAPALIKSLRLESWRLDFNVPSKGMNPNKGETVFFLDYGKAAQIYIMYDQCNGKADCLDTIFHELLHVKIYSLTKLIPDHLYQRSAVIEEHIVRTVSTTSALLLPKLLRKIDKI